MQEDPQYLKNFVKEHPENQMGWYLLGRHYDEAGQKEKALFCYAKAGSVFEAFEDKKLPGGVKAAVEQVQQAAQVKTDEKNVGLAGPSAATEPPQGNASGPAYGAQSDGRGGGEEERAAGVSGRGDAKGKGKVKAPWRKRLLRVLAALLLFLTGTLLAPSHDGGEQAAWFSTPLPEPGANTWLMSEGAYPAGDDPATADPDVAYVAADAAKLKAAAGELALQTDSRARILAEGPLSADGRWTLWSKSPRLVLAVSGSGNPNRQLRYYDANSCQCTPADSTAAAEAVAAWQARQEHEIVLRSAELAFRKRHGRLPQSLDELTGNYPDNSLSGITREMKAVWEAQKGQQPPGSPSSSTDGKAPAKSTAVGTDKGANTATPAATAPPHQSKPRGIGVAPSGTPFTEPLAIIVDRTTYRLALVSGSVILRNYPVGLGGNKTPEGKFTVTEKVNKPNGKSVGPFGSRGMTLSDTLYAIHGTDEPDSIGKDESQGCVRMLKGDLEELYAMTPLGTPVTITSGQLPKEITRAKNRLHLPARAEEMNPAKVYSWLH